MSADTQGSELGAYVDQCEALVGKLIGVFPDEMVPTVIHHFGSHLHHFETALSQVQLSSLCSILYSAPIYQGDKSTFLICVHVRESAAAGGRSHGPQHQPEAPREMCLPSAPTGTMPCIA
eukprot:scaffold201361_cov49-Prasinocladus_malaysianus.AAC.2